VVGRLDEPVKQRTVISLLAGLCGVAALHSQKPRWLVSNG